MTTICHSCTIEVTDVPIACNGFCKAVFHLKCSGVSPTALVETSNNKQLIWMCKSCTKLMDDIRFRTSVRRAYEAGKETALSGHKEIVEKLKSDILSELKQEIRSNFSALVNSSSLTPRSSTRTARRRRLFGQPEPSHPKVKNQKDLMRGTGESLSPSLGQFTAPPPEPKFWLYLSRISRDVTTGQVRDLAMKRLVTEDVEVVRLVAKGKDVNTMTFISFKIGLNPDLKSRALSTSTWPKGVLFREFKDNTKGNFWKPQRTPKATPSSDIDSPSGPDPEETDMME